MVKCGDRDENKVVGIERGQGNHHDDGKMGKGAKRKHGRAIEGVGELMF